MKKNNIKFYHAVLTLAFFCTSIFSLRAERPTAESLSGSPYDNRSDSIDILHTTAWLDFSDFSGKILWAHTTLKCLPKINGINKMRFDLMRIGIDSIKVNNILSSYSTDDTSVNLNLPTSLNVTDTFNVSVWYHGTPFQNPADWGGFYWTTDYAFNIGVSFLENQHSFGRTWIPCFDNFSERCTYEYYVTTDSTRKAYCGGLLLGQTRNPDGSIIWHWKIGQQITSYLASVTISNYTEIRYSLSGIDRSIPVILAAVPSDTARLSASFFHLPNALQAFENSYGAYAFDRIGYSVVPFSAGAMEHACNISYMQALVDGSLSYETTMAHELSHHWFGDLVTCENANEMWLNEGWASYSENIFLENLYGINRYKDAVRENHHYSLQFNHVRDNGYYALSGIPSSLTYGKTIYNKGSDVAHTLRGYMGDTMFFRVMKDYLRDYSFKSTNSLKFRDFISSHSSFNANAFFDSWVFNAGYPQFSIDHWQSQSAGGNFSVDIWIRQKLNHAPAYFRQVPLEISFFDSNWHRIVRKIAMDGACGGYNFNIPFNPVFIALDYDEKISDAITDEVRIISGNVLTDFGSGRMSLDVKRVTDSVLVRVEHNWVAPDPMRTAIPGLQLHNSRYWKIDGIFDSTFKANGIFPVNGTTSLTNGYLDNDFVTNRDDSIFMMYRPDATSDWAFCDSFKNTALGSATDKLARITVYGIKKGEYTLAIWNHSAADTSHYRANCVDASLNVLNNAVFSFDIYPNPAENLVNISLPADIRKVSIQVYDLQGRLVMNKLESVKTSCALNLSSMSAGTYLIKVTDLNSGKMATAKLIRE